MENAILEPGAALSNPLQLALVRDNYDMAVLEPTRVRYFIFTGSGFAENPALAVTGIATPKAEEVPDGTIVQADLAGTTASGAARLKTSSPFETNLVKIEGNVYEDWMVVIQGRD